MSSKAHGMRPSEVLGVQQGTELRVPIGVGCVVPAWKLIELLETDKAQKMREELEARPRSMTRRSDASSR